MPKTNLLRPERKTDYIKAIFLDRMNQMNLHLVDLYEPMGMSRPTFTKRMQMPTDEWSLGDIKKMCKLLEIPISELRENVRF